MIPKAGRLFGDNLLSFEVTAVDITVDELSTHVGRLLAGVPSSTLVGVSEPFDPSAIFGGGAGGDNPMAGLLAQAQQMAGAAAGCPERDRRDPDHRYRRKRGWSR